MSHLIELRSRLLKILIVIGMIFLVLFPFGDELYTLIAKPMLEKLPLGSSMIAIDVTSPFLIPFKLVMLLSIFIAVPFILYHAWAFVAPGLYRHERNLILPLLVSSTLLFYLGVLFAYFIVFPVIFGFIVSMAPEGISVMTDMGRYLDFVSAIFLAFGVAFEIPVATVLLVAVGLITPAQLREKRPYVIVFAFVVGMLLTPPDVVSQIMLAIPMWILYEVGILASALSLKHRRGDNEKAGS